MARRARQLTASISSGIVAPMTSPEPAAFVGRIVRHPEPFDADAGANARAAFGDLPPAATALLSGVAGCSPFLAASMRTEARWLREALARAPEDMLAAELAALGEVPPDGLGQALRRAKRRIGLLAALADCGGVWPLDAVTAALSDLADRALSLGLRALTAAAIRKGRLPGASVPDADTAAGMVVIAMGKLGAGELNYSSDIDLVCLFDETRYPGCEAEARAAFVRIVRNLCALISDRTADGYVFRTDLRLRPDAAVTPVCLSMAVAETYYESVGRTWERAAYIKARPAAGDLAAGARFLASLRPFVWRRHLDFAAIEDAHGMRLKIREHRSLNGPVRAAGHDLKLGVGGIREIEFFTQTRQLIAGGRDPDLRSRATVEALGALAAKGWVPTGVAEELTTLYRAHREVEHRLQMIGDAQTHTLPTTTEGLARVARFCGCDDPAAWSSALERRLRRTEALTEGFFAPSSVAPLPDMPDATRRIVDDWSRYPALRSDRAATIFRRLQPAILTRLMRADQPQEALLAFDGFLGGLPAGVQIFSLFDSNPALVDLVVDICATSPALGIYLSRNAGVLDAVIGGQFFGPFADRTTLAADLADLLVRTEGYERRLDATRAWMKERHFRIGVHHLRHLIDGAEAGARYADLAGAVLAALWPVVGAEFARRHGPAPGQGAMLLAMGSLGAGRLNAASDLDLIVIYDAGPGMASDGPRPLPARAYFARLTQAMITALTAPMAAGRLYEVDMRLRPSGRQGPVATSLVAFAAYQRDEAWTWEHLALTRALPLIGEAGLLRQVEALRREVLASKAGGADVRADVAAMRARLADARPGAGGLDASAGTGRLRDVELAAQTAALLAANPARQVEDQIQAGVRARILSQSDARALREGYSLCWQVRAAQRLLSGADEGEPGRGGRDFILREAGQPDTAALTAALEAAADRASEAILRLLDEEVR